MKTKNMKPVIGITMCLDRSGLVRKGVDYSLIRSEYGEQVKAVGGSPIFLDHNIDPKLAASLCDGIIISGGEDINPDIYGDANRHVVVYEPVERTLWERQLITACDHNKIRVLGICYGSQLLNVHYGGTLYQDIAAETDSELDHGSSTAAAHHQVRFERQFLGYATHDTVMSASRHHQAVKDVGEGMTVVARAADGIVEAITGNGHFGVQWHAEADNTASHIYGGFLRVISEATLIHI